MFEERESKFSRYVRYVKKPLFLFNVSRWLESEFMRRDPEWAIDIPMMCIRHADILQLTDAQQTDLHTLVASIPDTTDTRREGYFFGKPRIGILRQYPARKFETETQHTPVNRGFLGMQIRVRRQEADGYTITALDIGDLPSADDVKDAFNNFKTPGQTCAYRADQLHGEHESFDLVELGRKDGVGGERYRHVHMIGTYGVTNSAQDVFRPYTPIVR